MGAEHDVTDQLNEVDWLDLEAAYTADQAAAHPLTGKHVLIVGINYAPEPTGIAPYTTQIAEHFAEVAASVTVLAGPPSYPAWRVDPEHRGRHRVEWRNGVEVHRLWHYVPKRQTGARRAVYEATFGAHVAAAGRRLKQRPDLVFAVVPSLAGAAAAGRIAKRHGAALMLHVQDLMGRAAAQSGMAGGQRLAGAAGRLERQIALQADRIAIVSEAFRPVLHEYGVRDELIVSLPNWTHIGTSSRDRDEVRGELGWAPGVTVALHTGNMGWKQDLGNIVEAARLSADRDDLLWVLMGDGSQRVTLVDQAAGISNVRFMDPVAPEHYPEVLAAADVLLVNERPSVGDMSLPSKITSYASVSTPVVAAVPAEGVTAAAVANDLDATVVTPGCPAALLEAIQSARTRVSKGAVPTLRWQDRVAAIAAGALRAPGQRRCAPF